MSNVSLLIPDMPFCLGAMNTPKNPLGIPNVYPFQLEINSSLGRLEQTIDAPLEKVLKKAYEVGNEMGTPSDNTELGLPYVDDFIRFIDQSVSCRGSLLEIGAGTGFMSKRLSQDGWQVTSIEPGVGYEQYWESHGVEVINDFFPTNLVQDQFDVIIFYTVLEHLKDTKGFLASVRKQLKPDGKIFLAVPDCTLEISQRDPSILLHEHFHYFTKASLANTMFEAGLTACVEPSQFGRSLFAVGTIAADAQLPSVNAAIISDLETYITYIPKARASIQDNLTNWLKNGEVGMFCASRLLNFCQVDADFLFYDDAEGLKGKYYPPFTSAVGNREKLFNDVPKTLLIGSRTFGKKLKSELLSAGLKSNIILMSDLI